MWHCPGYLQAGPSAPHPPFFMNLLLIEANIFSALAYLSFPFDWHDLRWWDPSCHTHLMHKSLNMNNNRILAKQVKPFLLLGTHPTTSEASFLPNLWTVKALTPSKADCFCIWTRAASSSSTFVLFFMEICTSIQDNFTPLVDHYILTNATSHVKWWYQPFSV